MTLPFSLSKDNQRILKPILESSRLGNIQLYIVGGFLRDIILGREKINPDIDFTVEKNAIAFAAALAKRLKAGFVVLDKANGCARVVKKVKDKAYTLDFTDFRGRDLLQDLGKRDFSINTLAVELKAFLETPEYKLIDPYNGLKDLKSGIIRVLSPGAFDDDPLRILRSFSLSCTLNFKIQPLTMRLIDKKRSKLKDGSFERVRDELFKILASSRGYEFLSLLDRHKILELIIPEIKVMHRLNQGPFHHLDVWQHTLETVKQIERIIRNSGRSRDIKAYLNEEISSGRRRYELLKLTALGHDIGKPKTLRIEDGKIKFHGHEHVGAYMAEKIAQRIKLSNPEIFILKKIILFHLRPGYMSDIPALSMRAKFRFFRDAGEEAASVLLISLADQRATKGALTTAESRQRHERLVRRLLNEYFRKKKEKKTARLINGNDLIKRFKLEPSPLIGKILSEVEEAQAIGKLKTKKEALKIAEMIIREVRKK
ncbi:MAG: HD domain-containing protein [Candidatus Omnitrophota bacterium]